MSSDRRPEDAARLYIGNIKGHGEESIRNFFTQHDLPLLRIWIHNDDNGFGWVWVSKSNRLASLRLDGTALADGERIRIEEPAFDLSQ